MTEPVAESLLVHWRPSFRYHLHRLKLLEDVDSEGLLEQFRVTPKDVGVRTGMVQLTMTENGLALSPRGSLLGEESLGLLRRAFDSIAPPRFSFELNYQFLTPIPSESYDRARVVAIDRVTNGLFGLGATDFSLLVDGKALGADWQGEFGVVSEAEVEPRLRRWLSRVGRLAEGPELFPLYRGLPSDIAPVSFFADFMWTVPSRDTSDVGGDVIDDIARLVQALSDETSRIVDEVNSRVQEGSLQSIGGSET